MHGSVIQRRLVDAGHEQIERGKSHDLAVDMDGGKSRCYNLGFRRIVKPAQPYILRNGISGFFQHLQSVQRHKVVGA